jgi:hypothetical protein
MVLLVISWLLLLITGVLIGIGMEHEQPDVGTRAQRLRAVRAEQREANLLNRISQLEQQQQSATPNQGVSR